MNIGILCSSTAWGGLEINTLYVACELQKRDFQVTVYCERQSKIAEEARKANVPVTHFAYKKKHLNFGAARRLGTTLDKEEISILLITHYSQYYIGVMSKLFSKQKPKTVYMQQMQMKHRKKDPYHTFFYKRTDAWIVALDFIKKQLGDKITIDPKKTHVITPFVNIDHFVAAKEHRTEAREKFKVSQDVFVAGIVGRIDKIKGQEYLIKAIKLLQNEGINIHGLIVGDESIGNEQGYGHYLKQLVKNLELENVIHFSSFIEDSPQAFGAMDVFIMSSFSEPFGMVTVEAMASGLPVIGTDAGGTTEILDNGNAGMLIPPQDEFAIADALKKLYQDNTLRNQLGNVGQKRAMEKYSDVIQCKLLEDLFKSL